MQQQRKHRIHHRPIKDKTSGFCFDLRAHASYKIQFKEPDLSYVKSAAEIAGKNLKKGAVVVLEKSTIYPGVTEEIIAPILDLENGSGLKCGVDFKIGYSPERINPGDEAHALDKITKIVAGMDTLFCKQKPLLKNIPIVFLLAQVFFFLKRKSVLT
jgi:UDP-N-acetyl-D-mannosaminuronate dehydrogenase